MANAFKNKTQRQIGTALTAIESYTIPVGMETTTIGLTISNTTLSPIEADAVLNTLTTFVQLEDESAGNNILMEDTSPETFVIFEAPDTLDYYIVKGAPIPAGGSLVAVGGDQKVVLMAGDTVKVRSNTELSADTIMSVLEIT